MKRKLSVVIMFIMLLPSIIFASNGSLAYVDNQAIINQDGTVNIKQTWEYNDTQVTNGTEHFINLKALYNHDGNVGTDETITNYKVYLNDKPLEFKSNWNIDDSFDEKSGKYGIVEKSSSVELCFGITKHEINKFRVEYTVHNAIKETTDGSKYLHWTFTPTDLNPSPNRLSAIIETNGDFMIDKIYGFNYEGQVNFDDMTKKSKVTATMEPGTYQSNTVLNIFALLKDDNNIIMNTKLTNQTLEDKITQIFTDSNYDISDFNKDAQQESNSIAIGSSSNEEDTPFIMVILMTVVLVILSLIAFALSLAGPAIFIIVILSIAREMQNNVSITKDVSKEQKNIWWKDKTFYRRQEPEEIIGFYPVIATVTYIPDIKQNVLLYFISKWTSEEVFQYVGCAESEGGPRKRKSTIVTFKINENKLSVNSCSLEKALFAKFAKLASSENMLNTQDLNKLNISKLEKIFFDYKNNYKTILADKDYVVGESKKARITDTGIEVINQHVGLKNFLRDFTLINERETSEIQLWDYYFHMAAFYGLADVFKKQLDKLPNLDASAQQAYDKYYGSSGVGILNRSVSSKVVSKYSSYTSRSSGGGGSSSSSGGGGSSGGGSGGGTR